MLLTAPSPTLDLANPCDWASPLNAGLLAWFLVLPGGRYFGGGQLVGGWRNLAIGAGSPGQGVLTNMGSTSTSGANATTRPGGWGELRFDGSDDRVVFPRAWTLNDFTLSCWVYSAAVTQQTLIALMDSNWSTDSAPAGICVLKNGAALQILWRPTNGAAATTTTAGTFPASAWCHVVYTRSGTAGVGFVNGTVQATLTTSAGALALPRIQGALGMLWNGSAGWVLPLNGALDDVRLYNRALSPWEIGALRREALAGSPTTPRRLRPPWGAGTSTGVLVGHNMRGGFQRGMRGGFLN